MRLPILVVAGLLALTCIGTAAAETVVAHDAAGRTITFDVLAPDVDVEWYASLLRGATHGDEISTVTIRIVTPEQLHERCGAMASGCYSGRRSPTITVAAGTGRGFAAILLHEYGHHLDAAWRVDGVAEPNGTPVWWALRRVAELRSSGAAVESYDLGWSRGLGEIFAEDYAYIHLGDSYGIPWLHPPADQLKEAMLAELRGESRPLPPVPSLASMLRPAEFSKSGTLPRGARHEESFRLLGPGRRVTLTASVSGRRGPNGGARAVVTCNGAVVKAVQVAAGRSATLDLPRLGPAECTATLVSTGRASQRFSYRLRLAVEA